MTAGWRPPRVLLASIGAAALLGGGVGSYLSLDRTAEAPGARPVAPAQPESAAIHLHPAPRELPRIAFRDGKGRSLTLADFRGKTVLLNVWATWCPPCREEMPSLDRLQKALGGPAFEVVALSIDTGGAAVVERFYKEVGIGALAIHVDSTMRAASELRTPGVPTTLLIDAEGRELGRHAGPATWDDPEVLKLVARYLPR
ncbi:MAG TPA: TlpA disulfide reductase family protein [Burkholderiales bacterium]|nr:TlpA disulfide reductase family protein [Burkholderiales bacterium]